MNKKECLAGLFDAETKVLILGTMPGEKSLGKQQYYSHSGNVFWDIVAHHFNNGKSLMENERYDFLRKHHIGLWDVLQDCDRHGSLDKDIKNQTVNDFSNIKEQCPNLQRILLNGGKAYKLFIKHFPQLKDISECMPSTSQANAIPKQDKIAQWRTIRDYVGFPND